MFDGFGWLLCGDVSTLLLALWNQVSGIRRMLIRLTQPCGRGLAPHFRLSHHQNIIENYVRCVLLPPPLLPENNLLRLCRRSSGNKMAIVAVYEAGQPAFYDLPSRERRYCSVRAE